MSKINKRSLSRLMAIQIFYQNDFFDIKKDIEEVKSDVIENYLLDAKEDITDYSAKVDNDFLDQLISGLSLDIEKNDQEISSLLQDGYSLKTLDNVMLQIFRLGAFELNYMHDIPAKVVIDEYVDIYASFFDDKKVKFANAILDGLAKKFRINEFK